MARGGGARRPAIMAMMAMKVAVSGRRRQGEEMEWGSSS
jgi:hypothetical protein